jgi:diguanylate cyclase
MEPPKPAAMSSPTANHPAELARAAIRLLANRRMQPTPDNFRRAYSEVSGEKDEKPETPAAEATQLRWAEVIRPLIKQWEGYQTGLTQSKKREMLDRVLINFGHDSQQLFEKLGGLARSWGVSGSAATALEDAGESTSVPTAETTATSVPAVKPDTAAVTVLQADSWPYMRQVMVGNLHLLAASCETRWPELSKRANTLASGVQASAAPVDGHFDELAGVWREILIRADDDHELSLGLRRLVGLLFLNLGELVGEESWFSGQVATMRALIDGNLNPDALQGAERGLRELVFKQGVLKGSLDEAKDKLRSLIATFIDRIGAMSEDADGYHARIGAYSEQIGQAHDIGELGAVIEGLTGDMDRMRQALRSSHGELNQARAQAESAELRIHALEKELEQVSNLVREDQLTGALNRRGMDEAFNRELARADRLEAPMSVSLLDLDHFKKLNDSYGHQAGDEALKHLTRVVRELLRPTDTLARYGGEEFLILLPNTDLEEAERIMKRLQRELTRQFFLHDNEKVLITFSAGVAERTHEETQADLTARVDAAMYRAKSAGRNRVERG